jgi:hypothetical protein
MNFKRIFFTALLWLLAASASAAQIKNLYQIQERVPAQQQGAPLAEQLQAGLERVLTKVTGRTDLKANAVIKAQLSAAIDYLQTFRYEVDTAAAASEPSQMLIMDFNQVAVEGLIKHAGLKSLGAQRPSVLLWIASDKDGQQAFLTEENQAVQLLLQEASRRGLPIQMPLYDLEDQTRLPVSDLWGLFNDPIKQASSRYLPDAVIAARLQTSASGFAQLEWLLIRGVAPERHSTAGQVADVIPELINTTADKLLAARVTPERYDLSYFQKGIQVNISNINDLSDYIKAVDYIRSLPVVRKLRPESVRGSDITIRLELDGNSVLLKEALALEPRLQMLDFSRSADGSESLHYIWRN